MNPQFGSLQASELYCPKCKRAQRVRERLLLVLPNGELHEYVCAQCGSSLAKRTITGAAVTTPINHPRPLPSRKLLK